MTITPVLQPAAGYDPLTDFVPVSLYATMPNILCVNLGIPVTTVGEFIKHVKANPGKVNFASAGIGSVSHLNFEVFMDKTGMKAIHVPYKGGGQAIGDVVAGHVPMTISSVQATKGLVESGKMKALAVGAAARMSTHPDVPTLAEAGFPDIDPKSHTLTIHGLVDRPLTLSMDDLRRFPSVTRLHFIECAGNRASRRAKTVQETHGMTSNAEWTGVLLSTILKECGLKGSATWFVAEGSEEVKGASSMPIAKAMDDCLIAYGMNGEAVRPQNGFPLRLMVRQRKNPYADE